MLKQRILTASILIPIVLLILFYLPPIAFCFLITLISLAATWEWTNLMQIKKPISRIAYLLLVLVTFFTALFIPVSTIFLIALVWWLFAFVLILFYPRLSNGWGNSQFCRALMGILVMLPCWTALNYIRNQKSGVYAILFLFVLIWGADSAAYFAGKVWGKTKLAPQVSPGKSWQGFIAALIFAILLALFVQWLSNVPTNLWIWGLLVSLVTTIFSVIGDLFESMLKRKVGLKDSGNLLPGHGGVLDRIDSLTAAAPIFALSTIFIGLYLSLK